MTFASLENRKAVVTGASSGIGRAIALECARGGADVVVHCRSSTDRAREVCDEIRSLGRAAELIQADVSLPAGCELLIAESWSRLGPIDIWINNAGADVLTTDARQLEYDDRLALLLDTDVRSTARLGRNVARKMTAEGSGVILNIGWDQADRGMEGESGELFAATKNAIMGLTRSLALSFAPQVRVNCIAPGWIRTAWGETASDAWQQRVLRETPLQRWGTPEDIAKVARFLVSPDAAYLTGQVVNVNGGAVR